MIRIYGPQNRTPRPVEKPGTRRQQTSSDKNAVREPLQPGEIRVTRIPSLGEIQGTGFVSSRDL